MEGVDKIVWAVAVFWYVVVDGATTAIGFRLPGVVEANPFILRIGYEGLAGVAFYKLIFVVGGVAAWWYLPRGYDYGVPLGLTFVGIVVSTVNIFTILTAVL